MENLVDMVQSLILPVVTVVISYFGWRANADKNRLKAELETIKQSNISKEIENQTGWLDLYEKLHNDQAKRLDQAMTEIQQLKRTINKFENAFKKAHSCNHYDTCPIRDELSKLEGGAKRRTGRKSGTGRQYIAKGVARDEAGDNATSNGPANADA